MITPQEIPATAQPDRPSPHPDRPVWARGMTCAADFQQEQERFGEVWTFLGYLQDLPAVDDWFTATLGGRPVFVQRFKEGLRAYENICAHRYYPIRDGKHGNGPLVCPLHQWRYNADGLAVGVPKCEQMFGKTARELDMRLRPVELDVCGSLIFGRFGSGPSLREWLGPGADIIGHMTAGEAPDGRIELPVAAHWKAVMMQTMEEYHIVAIHPTTLGRNGFDDVETTTRYYRFGAHSAFFSKGEDGALEAMARDCREGRYHPSRYRILHFFPNLFIVHLRAYTHRGDEYWYLLITQLVPQAHDRTTLRVRFFPLPFERPAGPWRRLARRLVRPFIRVALHFYIRKIMGEDNRTSEQLQKVAHLVDGEPLYSRQEERIGWLEEEYAKVVADQPSD